jgi:hypothetical protein
MMSGFEKWRLKYNKASLPDSLIKAMAPTPGGVESAIMVSKSAV